MKIYSAAVFNQLEGWLNEDPDFLAKNEWLKDLNVLISYEYVKTGKRFQELRSCVGNLLLDSGAYTFQKTTKEESVKIDWEKYAYDYGTFIKENNIELFFELDIDNLVSYEKVLELRHIIESVSGKKSIPVWHVNRGKEEFIKMCQEYDYVAVGGLVGKGYTKDIFKYLLWFILTAHKYGAKIHGLGFTQTKKLKECPFDSVDSTTWINGAKYGELFVLRNGKMERIVSVENKVKVRSMKDYKTANLQNLKTWYQYQKYAERSIR